MMTKGPSRKQVIIPMSSHNANRIMSKSNTYIVNINKLLKDIKSDILANFMYVDNKEMYQTSISLRNALRMWIILT